MVSRCSADVFGLRLPGLKLRLRAACGDHENVRIQVLDGASQAMQQGHNDFECLGASPLLSDVHALIKKITPKAAIMFNICIARTPLRRQHMATSCVSGRVIVAVS